MAEYRETLNLPKTAFPMKADLPLREPVWLERWAAMDLYGRQRRRFEGRPKFILHDGPPYANGDIHLGTALNKVVKDIINRFHTLAGENVVFVPGWDTHGLPIEMRALRQLGVDQHQIDPLTLRRECAGVARHYIGVMTEEFRRLGVFGDWEHPYVTMDPAYEAAELGVFADMVERGLIYRDLKPVYWCPHCETALAEGEIEYQDHRSDSIYVAFDLIRPASLPAGTRAVIWTTTPWTLPANVAIAVHPDLEYVVVETAAGPLLLARDRLVPALAAMGLTDGQELAAVRGRALEGLVARHPYLPEREVPLILGEHVSAESGTGLVHTAPGHGLEDWEAGRHYRLPVLQPIDDRGRFEAGTPLVEGMFYADANPVVLERLRQTGSLLGAGSLVHQYPFCWRCHNPVIYRATSQWFLSVDRIREELVESTYPVQWHPEWGGERMRQMVRDRDDWCLSRQRVWGLPIPAFYCGQCGQPLLDAAVIRYVAARIGEEGSDSWWEKPADHFLPPGTTCPACGHREFRQERDVFDVWMDSGSSHAAVLARHPDLEWPADLVLEGADQYRGWFNSLLTTGVATRDRAPYKAVLTHGWTLDGEGRPMHKSLGNVIDPMELVDRYGADVLRLWVASSDYTTDVRVSPALMEQLAEAYRKIRNTWRFLLGNLADFDPDRDTVPLPPRDALNRWMLARFGAWLEEARDAYGRYEFHAVIHSLLRLVTVDLSNFYLDVSKDRLYTLYREDPLRRETQTVLWVLADALLRVAAPVLVFTAEEAWRELPHRAGDPESVHLATWPEWAGDPEAAAVLARFDERLLPWRERILKGLEQLRAQKRIGNSLQAGVRLGEGSGLSAEDRALLKDLLMVAEVEEEPAALAGEEGFRVYPVDYPRCARCWRYVEDVGSHPGHPDLCGRCVEVLDRQTAGEG
ncbi:isoleucyl-tRNA synthetase [Candidatus Hydrogenisulfobacillus filiaventi]|uniref:Isoleucine--tRNA ligase n=1 Tax=Candidatus Hydrogenisulfobacillus filiaventi TaxID=2707344 RepID=A0A6F8ZFR9_9FIRM|nr:isoleucine--tRNA ligase [Bacillota bacterium]CAB1128483.1 isoleucyl-tRNA synthetase [Candidatus Hydrogenisulfobacillus filiaventi]